VAPELQMAKKAGLVYSNLNGPGYGRKRCGKGFVYYDPDGNRVTDKDRIKRFKSLVIPPAWENVWISPGDNGHIQATGRDARGRKQYLYHSRWQEISNSSKFEKLAQFGEMVSKIRRQVSRDLELKNWTRRKVTALAVRILDESLIRIGNLEYEKANQSFGLTTLNRDHVNVEGDTIHLAFRGKRGKDIEVDIRSKRLADLVRKCEELPGQKLFQYRDEDGKLQTLSSEDVNEYLQETTQEEFSAKDFRTWGATVRAVETFFRLNAPEAMGKRRKATALVVKEVAKQLGNTPAICRRYYIHPKVLEAFENDLIGKLLEEVRGSSKIDGSLSRFEHAVLRMLKGITEKPTGNAAGSGVGGLRSGQG
jgi:DNA topoisomerase I